MPLSSGAGGHWRVPLKAKRMTAGGEKVRAEEQ